MVAKRKVEKEDRDKVDGVSLEHWRWFLEYHFNRMNQRRSLQLQIFTGYITLTLIFLKGAFDALSSQFSSDFIRLVLQITLVSFYICLIGFLVQIESQNRHDRMRYHNLADVIYNHLQRKSTSYTEGTGESLIYSIGHSWATTWPLIFGLILTVAGVILIQQIPHN